MCDESTSRCFVSTRICFRKSQCQTKRNRAFFRTWWGCGHLVANGDVVALSRWRCKVCGCDLARLHSAIVPPPHPCYVGRGGASLLRNSIMDSAVITSGFSFKHTSFELVFNSLSHCSSACPPPTEIELFILLFADDFTCLHCNSSIKLN